MAGVSVENFGDLVASTQRNLGRLKFTDLASQWVNYFVLPYVLRKKRYASQGGYGWRFNAVTSGNGQARHVKPFQDDQNTITDAVISGSVDARFTETSYRWDLRLLDLNAMNEWTILDMVKTERFRALVSLADLMESTILTKPIDSTDDETPLGLKYYIVSSAIAGFNGLNPAGFPLGAAGIDSNMEPRWRNYTDRYVQATKTDLVRKMSKAAASTNFISPVDHPMYDRKAPDKQILVNLETKLDLKAVGEQQNDNLGRDIDSMEGRVLFQGMPITYVPYLDNEASDPVIGVDWSVIEPTFQRGWYMKETLPYMPPNRRNERMVGIDFVWNLRCFNRRRLWIIDKSDWSAAA